jgi:hypothetical protein
MEAHHASLGYLEAPVDPAKRVLIGLLMALTGGSLSAVSLVSGTIQVSRGAEQISRTNAPDEFWSLVLGCAALAVIGTCLTVVTLYRMDNEEITEMLEALGISRRRLYQYLSLFCILAVIYSIYLQGILQGSAKGNFGGWPLAKFCLISALPFSVLAFSDKTWRSSDAAPVSLGAWAAVFLGFSFKYSDTCPMAAALLFLPLVLSALLAHVVGTLCNMATYRS